jgi:hypothetical protein
LRVEDHWLSVVQPREAAARGRRHDRERPERFGLGCVTPPAPSEPSLFWTHREAQARARTSNIRPG